MSTQHAWYERDSFSRKNLLLFIKVRISVHIVTVGLISFAPEYPKSDTEKLTKSFIYSDISDHALSTGW